MARKKPESLLASRIANHIRMKYPQQPFRFDLAADMPLPPHLAKRGKELHGERWNKKYPDLFIAKATKKYGGLYLELKAVNIYLEDGKTLKKNEHTEGQAAYHIVLRKLGYKCMFCIGYEECIKKIKKYLK